jgi:transposase
VSRRHEGAQGCEPFRDIARAREEEDDVFCPVRISANGADQAAKLDGFTGFIDQWMQDDLNRPRKQRHRAKRIFERLRSEHQFQGGYTTVKNYVREHGRRSRQMAVPLSHAPGHAQADFGAAMVVIGGVEQKAHFCALDLPHSDACFVRAYPAEVAGAWIDGHVHAFAFFGRVPQSGLYDNDRCLVAKIPPPSRQHALHAPAGQ